MIPEKITLQRIRFYDMDARLIPPEVSECIPRFDFNLWKNKGRTVYWKTDGTGINYFKDGIELAEGSCVSSDTFFNSLFIAYWLRLTCVKSFSLSIRTHGKFLLAVFQHTILGDIDLLVSREITNNGETSVDLDPSVLTGSLRLSFRLTSLENGSRLLGGEWQTGDASKASSFGIAIATFGRNAFAERLITRILNDSALRKEDIRIVLTDQNKVSELGHLNRDQCRVVTQDNLGSAAGLTRAVYEMLDGSNRFQPTHIMFLDDDIDLEADSILRAIRMMQYAKEPFIIGGMMLDLYRPNQALCHGENFPKDDQNVRNVRRNLPDADIADMNGLNAFSIPSDYDYTASWFGVYPVEIYSQIGFYMPFFISAFEEAEFCLRAREKGCLTFTVPGIGVWHLPFYSKADAYWKIAIMNYHQLVHHSLYGYEDCSKFFFRIGVKVMEELIQGKYRHAAAWVRAMEDYLGGWRHFAERIYPAHLQEVQAYLCHFDAEKQPPGIIKKGQVVEIKQRLKSVVDRFEKDGRDIQSDFARNLPSTTTMDSWKCCFAHGSLTAPLSSTKANDER